MRKEQDAEVVCVRACVCEGRRRRRDETQCERTVEKVEAVSDDRPASCPFRAPEMSEQRGVPLKNETANGAESI